MRRVINNPLAFYPVVFVGLLVLLAACGVTPTPAPPVSPAATSLLASATIPPVSLFPTATPQPQLAVVDISPLPTVTPAPVPAASPPGGPNTASWNLTAADRLMAGAGARLAFLAGGSLYGLDPTSGQTARLFQSPPDLYAVGRPAWSPDKSRIILTLRARSDPEKSAGQLYLAHTASGQGGKLPAAQPAGSSDAEPVWSPDGKTLAFTRTFDHNRNNLYEDQDRHEVWLADADGQNPRKLANGRQPRWSPDSQRLAFVTNGLAAAGSPPQDNALRLINARGQNEWEPVTAAKLADELYNLGYSFSPGTTLVQNPVWLDGGRRLAFTTLGHSSLVITVNSSTGRDLKIWDVQYEGGFDWLDSAAAGSIIAYQVRPPSGFAVVNYLNASGKPDPENFSGLRAGSAQNRQSVFHPALNADGSLLAYFKVDASGSAGLELIGASSGTLVIATPKNGALEEKEVLKGPVEGLAWSR